MNYLPIDFQQHHRLIFTLRILPVYCYKISTDFSYLGAASQTIDAKLGSFGIVHPEVQDPEPMLRTF
jgi:hypothetical protein